MDLPPRSTASPSLANSRPHHDAEEVRKLAADPAARRVTRVALDGCLDLEFLPDVIWVTLAKVNDTECRFIKTLDSDKRPGEKLDVYDALVCGKQVYVKIKIVNTSGLAKLLVVLSFKRNTYYDRTMR